MTNKTIPFTLIITLTLSIIFSCKKISTPDEASKAIFGQWTYKSDSGGFSGAGGSDSFNENSWIEFTKKGVFTINEGSKKKERRKFNIETNDDYANYAIIFKNNNVSGFSYKIDDDTLFLNERAADGYSYLFIRK